MTIDISPEAVANLADNLDEIWVHYPDATITEGAKTLRALSAALTSSQAETAAAYAIATHTLDKWATNLRDINFPDTAPVVEQCSAMIRALTPADSKAALDRMIAEAEERGMRKAAALCGWDEKSKTAILAAIPKGTPHE